MNNNELMSKLFDYSSPTYFRWKKENRPIIKLIEKYFSKEDLEEFLTIGKIQRLEESNNNDIQVDSNNELLIDHTKYQLKDKLQKLTDENNLEWLYNFFSKKILIHVLKNLSSHKGNTYSISTAKYFLIKNIQDTEVSTILKAKRNVLIKMIEKNLSNLECYVLIHHYEEVMNYKNRFGINSEFDKK